MLRYRRWLQEFGTNPPPELKRQMLEALKVEVRVYPDPRKTTVKGVFSNGYFTLLPNGRTRGLPGVSQKVYEIAARSGFEALGNEGKGGQLILRPQYQKPIDTLSSACVLSRLVVRRWP
jgi:hypothetical protein